MDLLAVDALHGKDGKEYILELNGTAIGILPKHWQQDTVVIKEEVIKKLNEVYIVTTNKPK